MGSLYRLEVYRGVFWLGFGFLTNVDMGLLEIMPVLYTYVIEYTHWSLLCPHLPFVYALVTPISLLVPLCPSILLFVEAFLRPETSPHRFIDRTIRLQNEVV